MFSIPITIIVAATEIFTALYLWHRCRRFLMINWMLLLCGVQAMIITLAWQSSLPLAVLMRPIGAGLIPTVTWLAYLQSTMRALRPFDLVHLLGPVVIILSRIFFPVALDVLIPLAFLVYGAAIVLSLRQSKGALALAYFSTAARVDKIWTIIALLLIVSALTDVLIFFVYVMGAGHLAIWIVNGFFIVITISLGVLGTLGFLNVEKVTHKSELETNTLVPSDQKIMETLEAHMNQTRAYLIPDLTLSKLARRLHIPINDLSKAVNAVTGNNISRYINEKRIQHAQQELLNGKSVTEAMFESGFFTKSNFNREFKRVTGQSPAGWKKIANDTEKSASPVA